MKVMAGLFLSFGLACRCEAVWWLRLRQGPGESALTQHFLSAASGFFCLFRSVKLAFFSDLLSTWKSVFTCFPQ